MPPAQAPKLDLFLDIGQLLSAQLDLGTLLTLVLELSAKVVGSESASLLLLDEKTSELYFDIALGLDPETAAVRLPVGEGIAGTVAKERAGAIINDVRQDPRWSPKMDEKTGFTTRSILAVPMITKGRLIGVLEGINKKEGAFSEDDLRTFSAFAAQVSVSIENARLFSSLNEERYRLQTVFTQMNDGALLCDAAGRVLLTNSAALRFLSPDRELFTMDEAFAGMEIAPPLPEILRSSSTSLDFEARRQSPTTLWLAGFAARVELGAGRAEGAAGKSGGEPGWLFLFRNVTDERSKERLERTFLSLISHKLKTPLAAILGYSDILMAELSDSRDPKVMEKAVLAVSHQSRKLTNIVVKLLNYTTLQDPGNVLRRDPCPVDELLAEAVGDLAKWLEERNAVVRWEPSGLTVIGDGLQLREVFKNLIENAVKFDSAERPEVRVWAERQGRSACVSVEDKGPGIPPEEVGRVFSRFHQVEASFTGQVEGLGLGLASVKKVVTDLGGQVEIKSRLKEGTTVTVCLPLVEERRR